MRLPLALAFAGLCLVSATSFAEGPPAKAPSAAPPHEAAQQHFKAGRDAFKRGAWAEALDAFHKAYLLYPAPGTLLNMALAEKELGKHASAYAHLKQIAREFSPDDPRSAIIANNLGELTAKLALVVLQLSSEAADAAVFLDGVRVEPPRLGVALPLDPGPHAVLVSAPGRPDTRFEFVAAAGSQLTLPVHLAPAPARSTDSLPPPPTTPRAVVAATPPDPALRPIAPKPPLSVWTGHRVAGVILGGVAVASAAAGAAVGGLALSKHGELGRLCPDRAHCTAQGSDVAAQGRAFSRASTVLLAEALAASLAAVTLVVTAPSGKKTPPKVGLHVGSF